MGVQNFHILSLVQSIIDFLFFTHCWSVLPQSLPNYVLKCLCCNEEVEVHYIFSISPYNVWQGVASEERGGHKIGPVFPIEGLASLWSKYWQIKTALWGGSPFFWKTTPFENFLSVGNAYCQTIFRSFLMFCVGYQNILSKKFRFALDRINPLWNDSSAAFGIFIGNTLSLVSDSFDWQQFQECKFVFVPENIWIEKVLVSLLFMWHYCAKLSCQACENWWFVNLFAVCNKKL